MSTQERKKPEKSKSLPQEKSSKEYVGNTIFNETIQSTKSISLKEQEAEQEKDSKTEFLSILPNWIEKPWMYVIPTHDSHLSSWIGSWQSLILSYAEIFNKHVINITDLLQEYPFTNRNNGKSLTKSAITSIMDDMVLQGLVVWLDENKILVRVYFLTLDQWQEVITNHLFKVGYAAEVITIFELQNMNQKWSSLPRDDLLNIFSSLVRAKRAMWADSNKDSIKLII